MNLELLFPYLTLAAYLLFTLWVGLIGYRSQKNTAEDYFLANRSLGAIILFFTLSATNFSAFTFLGFAGSGYRIGISYYPMMAWGTGFAALTFYFIGDRVWRLGKQKGFITPAELIADRFQSEPLKLIFLAVMVIFTLPYLTLQPIGAGYLLENLTDGQVPYFIGATFVTLAIVFYVCIGGMKSVALTDVFQGALMFVLMIVAFMAIAQGLGGISEANQAVYDLKPELFSRQGADNFFTQKKWFSYVCLWTFTLPMFPQMFMRFYTPKTTDSLKVATIFYPIITIILFICPVSIGMWGHLAFPELAGKAADEIFPLMLGEYTSKWLASLVMVGALSAFMSTLDSQLLALSSMMTRDVYTVYFRPQASLSEQTLVGRLFIIILALIGLSLAYQPPESILALATEAFTGLSVLFPTVIAALYFKNVSSLSCMLSIIFGEGILIGLQTGVIPSSFTLGFLPVIPIVAISSLIIILGTLLFPKSMHH
ncbi:sodium:solute symporter family protein [Pleurocapsa sp. PCC 7319]|uniref:sodium:solute symporter family protein n=1 Tax=Pleurocapsa sp. PCC 7319 TaxID=118161 RepID=UPI000348D114|nr:sodium:solute symporter family protein [Pleurocapsa sp. PCC 7319]